MEPWNTRTPAVWWFWVSILGCLCAGALWVRGQSSPYTTQVLRDPLFSLWISTNVSTSSKVVYASRIPGIHMDASFTNGTVGTDDSVVVNNVLHSFRASGGGVLVVDGTILMGTNSMTADRVPPMGPQTTLIYHPPNTTIYCLPGCGFVAAPRSNTPIIGNTITGDPLATKETNFALVGGIYDGNVDNQIQFTNVARANRFVPEAGDTNNVWVMGFWYSGFDGLTIKNVELRNASCFNILLANGRNVVLNRNKIGYPDYSGADLDGLHLNGDGIHHWADLENLDYSELTIHSRDDGMAFNGGEGAFARYNQSDYVYWLGARWLDRLPYGRGQVTNGTWGTINNIKLHNITLDRCYAGFRWLGYNYLWDEAVDNVEISDIKGNIVSWDQMANNSLRWGRVSVDGWHVVGNGSICIGGPGAAVTVKNAVFWNYNYPRSATNAPLWLWGDSVMVSGVTAYPASHVAGTAAVRIDGARVASVSDVNTFSLDYAVYVPPGLTITNFTASNINQPDALDVATPSSSILNARYGNWRGAVASTPTNAIPGDLFSIGTTIYIKLPDGIHPLN